ncbi:MAG: tRNA pseudouridine(55) synthase TruB [Chitinophagaceae bacterium]
MLSPIEMYAEGQVLLMHKPLEWTSFNVVSKIRSLTRVKKVGHAGTLDPLATGLLLICTGKYTKKINELMGLDKEYTGTITLGSTTESFDLETEPSNFIDTAYLTKEAIIAATEAFKGELMQFPPQHSAIKKNGVRLYETARQGITVEVAARRVQIHAFDITHIEGNLLHFRVLCSTGTYIRSLANDFGAALGVGGHLSSLCRTKIGDYQLTDAWQLPQFEEHIAAIRKIEKAD